MSQIRCEVKDCKNRAGGMCMEQSILISQDGTCLNNTIMQNIPGKCLSCVNCGFLKFDNILKPTCKAGNIMNFEREDNECWIRKN